MSSKIDTTSRYLNDSKLNLCCYCGTSNATTKDHVPPKSIFNKPRPNDLITVPCCFECNNAASIYDEKFRAYLGMHIARLRGDGEVLFKQGALPTVRHNNVLRNRIFESLTAVNLVTNSGVFIGRGATVLWDSDVHDKFIERLIKGLFFHQTKRILTDNAEISVYFFNSAPKEMTDMLAFTSIAQGNFVYGCGFSDDSIYNSAWLFEFYGGHWAGGITVLKN